MKKLLCVLVCILLLAGCNNNNAKEVENEIPDFNGFKTDVYTDVNGIKISAYAEYSVIDELVLTITSPESAKGMKIISKDGECKVDFQELSFSFSDEYLPFNAVCVSLKSCAENIKTATAENEYYSYSINGYNCHLYVDDETKHFQKLTVNGTDTLIFENFEYFTGQTE